MFKIMRVLCPFLLFPFLSASVAAQNTWYVINNVTTNGIIGWNNAQNWTLDASGSVFYNPGDKTPSDGDHIVVKAGKEITIPAGTTVRAGNVTLDGNIFIDEAASTSSFASLKGSGSLYLKGDNFPVSGANAAKDFISEGGGTVVLRNNADVSISHERTFNNLLVNMSGDAKVFLKSNLRLNGDLTMQRGTLIVSGNNSNTIETLGSVMVESAGAVRVSNSYSNVYHNLIVWKDLKNYGILKFSNAAQYAAATDGAIRLTFKGASDNNFIVNGPTSLYRLFIDKGDDDYHVLSVTSNDVNYFKLFGPYENSTGIESSETSLDAWKKLPLVLTHGTLKLGANIKILQLGFNRDGNGIKEFFVPSTAALWINGADVVAASGFGGAQEWTGITLAGTLRISDGSFSTSSGSYGLSYQDNVGSPASLIVEGGLLELTQLVQKNKDGRLNYKQSGGTVSFSKNATNNWTYPVFHMPNEEQIFDMSGGKMIFHVANTYNVTGIYINSNEGNVNVTGGEVQIFTPSDRDFKICSKAPFFNLTTTKGGGVYEVQMTNQYGSLTDTYFSGDMSVKGNLSVGTGTTFNTGAYNLKVGGSVTLDGTFTNSKGKLTMNRSGDATLTNNTGNKLKLNKLIVEKSSTSATVSLSGTGGFSLGKIAINKGDLDFVDKAVPVSDSITLVNGNLLTSGTGVVELTGESKLNSAKGKTLRFGRLNVQHDVSFTSDALVHALTFNGDHIVDISSHNLEIEQSIYAENDGWKTTRMYRTNGLASDGGLTLSVKNGKSGDDIQFFPVGINDSGTNRFTPMRVDANTAISSDGSITMRPVNDYHPTVSEKKYVLGYFWRVESVGLGSYSENIRYLFQYDAKINVPDAQAGLKTNKPTGIFFTDHKWNEDEAGNGVWDKNKNLLFGYKSPLSQDFTFGVLSSTSFTGWFDDFHEPNIYYSRSVSDAKWDERRTWSLLSPNGDPLMEPSWVSKGDPLPGPADYCIISSGNTVIIASNSAKASQVEINGTLIVKDDAQNHDIDVINGTGRLIYEENDSPDQGPENLISADYSEFCNSASAIIEFSGSGSYHIPSNGTFPYYPNLTISGGGTKSTPYNGNVTVKGDLYVDDANFTITGIYNGELDIGKNLKINTGTLTLSGVPAYNTYIGNDIVFEGTGTLKSPSQWDESNIFLSGCVSLGKGSIDFVSEGGKVNLNFTGENSVIFSGNNTNTSNARLYRVTVDKPEGKEVDFITPFSLAADASKAKKPLVLQSGIAHLDNSGIDLTLNSGGDDFKVPAATKLIVDNGSKVRAAGSNSSLFLDGALEVINKGQFLWEGSGGNHVRYSASGKASISIGDNAVFHVGSQLYRNSNGGILSFVQYHAGSEVKIATVDAPEKNHAVFEILNNGSEFVQAEGNSKIEIFRGQTNANEPALNFDPETVNIAGGSKFLLAGADDQAMEIFANKPLENLEIEEGAKGSSVTLTKAPLILNGSLTVGQNSTFNADGLDLTLYGDLVLNGSGNPGAYNPGENTTWFESDGRQSVKGDVEFYDLARQKGTGVLTIGAASDVVVKNDLEWLAGSLNTDGKDLLVNGNVTTDASATLEAVEMSGSSEMQLIAGGGKIGRLNINNEFGVMVPSQPDPVSVSEKLILTKGVLNIGGNLLELGQNAGIEDGTGGQAFSANNMVQTFLSFTDAGVKKYFPAVSGSETFIYPIGSQNKFTPVSFTINTISAAGGSIRVKAANERHISIQDRSETAFDDRKNVLQYYWTLDADGISGFKGTVRMQVSPSDVKAEDGDVADYIPARILLGDDKWVRGNTDGFDESTNTLIFDDVNFFKGTDDLGIDGDYTAGLEDALPERLSTYISVTGGGRWDDKNTWAEYNPATGKKGNAGENVQQGGPLGCIVYIDKDVTMQSNGEIAYRTYINDDATLDVKNTVNHRLGDVFGHGRLRVETGSLPAGSYDNFFGTDGGTVEYSGTGNYSVFAEAKALNNVEFSGSGSRTLPNSNIRTYGDMIINGPTVNIGGTTSVEMGRTLVFDAGNIKAAPGSRFIFKGREGQYIKGAKNIVGQNALYNVTFNNSNGIAVTTDLEAKGSVSLVNGIINTADGGKLIVSNTAIDAMTGQTEERYIDGPLVKYVNGSETYSFAVGNKQRFGALVVNTDNKSGGLWEVQYYSANPVNSNPSMNPGAIASGSNVKFVSHNEYWRVKGPEPSNARVTVCWDGRSGFSTESAETAKLRIVQWNNAGKGWDEIDGSVNHNDGDAFGSLASSNHISFNDISDKGDFFTLGSVELYTYSWDGSIDGDWFKAGNWAGSKVPTSNTVVTIGPVTNFPGIGLNNEKNAYALDLTINNACEVTLHPGATLNITGSFVNNGDVILKSTPESVAALDVPVTNTNSGHGKIELSNLLDNQWYRLGQPIKSPTAKIYEASKTTSWIYRSTTRWERITSDAESIEPMEGIMVLYEKDPSKTHTIEYEGMLNTGEMTWSIPYGKGYYLFSNPYPGVMKWNVKKENSGITISDNLSPTIYYRIYAGTWLEDYLITYNGATGLSTLAKNGELPGGFTNTTIGNISPMQSVWVEVEDSNTVTIKVDNQARIAGNPLPLKSASADSDLSIIKIVQSNDLISDVAVVCFGNDFQEGKDRGDSPKKFNSSENVPEIFTREENTSLAINALPALTEEHVDIPLSVRIRRKGEVAISMILDDFGDDYEVSLEDTKLGETIDMRNTDKYSFEWSNSGYDHDRFVLHLDKASEVPTDITTPEDGNTSAIEITDQGEYALVKINSSLLNGQKATISLTDISGRLISTQQTGETETEVEFPDNTGVYIIRVSVGDRQKTGKVVAY
jgi:hypothetical protein